MLAENCQLPPASGSMIWVIRTDFKEDIIMVNDCSNCGNVFPKPCPPYDNPGYMGIDWQCTKGCKEIDDLKKKEDNKDFFCSDWIPI